MKCIADAADIGDADAGGKFCSAEAEYTKCWRF